MKSENEKLKSQLALQAQTIYEQQRLLAELNTKISNHLNNAVVLVPERKNHEKELLQEVLEWFESRSEGFKERANQKLWNKVRLCVRDR